MPFKCLIETSELFKMAFQMYIASKWYSGKEYVINAGDARYVGSIPGSGRSLEVGNSNPLEYSCLANSTDRGDWWPTVSVQFSSVTQSCLTLCDPMNRSMPGLPVHHHLPEFTQTHIH